jgi:hypothetical protein
MSKAMTYGAVGLAVFAVAYVLKTPGKRVANTSGQQQRDFGLMQWIDQINGQQVTLGGSLELAQQEAAKKLGLGSMLSSIQGPGLSLGLGLGLDTYKG